MRTEIVHRNEHLIEEYRPFIEGQRAIRIVDEDGSVRGECIWTLACKWRCVFEIKEIGVYEETDRRQGWASLMLREAIQDMRRYIKTVNENHRAWKVFLFCEKRNTGGRAFYESRGFEQEAKLTDFSGPGETALLYTLLIDEESQGS